MEKISIPHDALVLVGDGTRALLLRNKGPLLKPDLVVENQFAQSNPPTREQGTDQPGRLQSSVGGQRSATEETDWHQLGEDRFVAEVADTLNRLAQAKRFERLIIVAPPKALGTLRKALHPEVLKRVEAEVPKELATHSLNDIKRELAS